MRRFVLLAAAVPLLFAPTALAAEEKAERPSVCRAPDIDLAYDTETFTAVVSLPASGCETREHTMFTLSATISRSANQSGDRDLTQRSAQCGPFRSADDVDDVDDGQTPAQYFCDMALFLPHPEVEYARYDVDVTYPDASGDDRTMSVFTWCTSEEKTASCEG